MIYSAFEAPMYTASLWGVIRILLWIIFISYLLRMIARMSVNYAMNKTREELERQQRQATAQPSTKKNQTPVGEYVDYIEIKDDK
jgi:flagellar biosynthesis/type III secretory pathway M-ring protein FliF/YscJ